MVDDVLSIMEALGLSPVTQMHKHRAVQRQQVFRETCPPPKLEQLNSGSRWLFRDSTLAQLSAMGGGTGQSSFPNSCLWPLLLQNGSLIPAYLGG